MQRRPGIAHKENNKLVQTANAVPFNSTTTAVKGALGKGLDVIRFCGPTTFQFSKRVGIANLKRQRSGIGQSVNSPSSKIVC